MDLNKVMIIGRLTRDPESKTIASGQMVATFSVATNRQWTDKQSGEKKSQTEYHNIVAWRRLAEICTQYLKKGTQVYLEGHLQTRSWDDPSGVKKYRTEIVADQMIMLGGKGDSGASRPAQPAQPTQAMPASTPTPAPAEGEEVISVEDIPF
jgi:single-strand DNA-binding protein